MPDPSILAWPQRLLPLAALLTAAVSAPITGPAHAQMPGAAVWLFEGPGCRSPQATPGACAEAPLVDEILEWVAQQLKVPKPAAPLVLTLDGAALAQRLCPAAAQECAGIMAAYDAPSRTVILRQQLDMRRAPDRSFLVHELVHVVQHAGQPDDFQARCSDVIRTEREAYGVQNRFLAYSGQMQRVGQMMAALSCPSEAGEPQMLSATPTTPTPPPAAARVPR